MFKLDKSLENDTYFITNLELSSLLLMNNKNFPWIILVPRINDIVEFTDLDFSIQTKILHEINIVSAILQRKFKPYKLNIATLGNVTRQLHFHIIARFENDASFPRPVWGSEIKKYDEEYAQNLIKEIKQELLQNDILLKQILYRSIHRGCKETDFLIGEFAKAKLSNFNFKKLQLFKNFIEEDDLLIYDWILGKNGFDKKYAEIIDDVRVFHKISIV